jgi:hypothetical protein
LFPKALSLPNGHRPGGSECRTVCNSLGKAVSVFDDIGCAVQGAAHRRIMQVMKRFHCIITLHDGSQVAQCIMAA